MKIIFLFINVLILHLAVSAQEQLPLTLTLRANHSIKSTVYKNEPVLLSVTVTNKIAELINRENLTIQRKLDENEKLYAEQKLKQDQYEAEKKQLRSALKIAPVQTLGSSSRPWHSLLSWEFKNQLTGTILDIPVRLFHQDQLKPAIELNEKSLFLLFAGVDENLLSPGKYVLKLRIEDRESDQVQIQVLNTNLAENDKAMFERMLMKASYFDHAAAYEKGLAIANNLVRINDASGAAYSIRGDHYMGMKNYPEALKDYEKALALHYKTAGTFSEPPEYLLQVISFLRSEMGKKD